MNVNIKADITLHGSDTKLNHIIELLTKGFKDMALGQAELDAAVKAVEDDVANVVTAIADARTAIADLTSQVAALVAAGDTTAIVERLTAVDTALDAAAPGTAPTP